MTGTTAPAATRPRVGRSGARFGLLRRIIHSPIDRAIKPRRTHGHGLHRAAITANDACEHTHCDKVCHSANLMSRNRPAALVLIGAVLATLLWAATRDMERGQPVTLSECVAEAEPWPGLVAPGLTDGPVSLAGVAADTSAEAVSTTPQGYLRMKLLVVIDAGPGQRVVLHTDRTHTAETVRFTHGDETSAGEWDSASNPADLVLGEGSLGGRPIDVPGVVLAATPVDIRLIVGVGKRDYGPFCFSVGLPDGPQRLPA